MLISGTDIFHGNEYYRTLEFLWLDCLYAYLRKIIYKTSHSAAFVLKLKRMKESHVILDPMLLVLYS